VRHPTETPRVCGKEVAIAGRGQFLRRAMDAFESLTASYFDGRLTEREAAELAQVLDNDVEKAARFVGEYEIDRLLALRAIPADESRIDAILGQIQREADPFVQSVFRTIEHET